MTLIDINGVKKNKTLQNESSEDTQDIVASLYTKSQIISGISSNISSALQQSPHLGESSRQPLLKKIDHSIWSTTILRNVRLPLISPTFNYILRRVAFIPSILYRRLDLSWLGKNHNSRENHAQPSETPSDYIRNGMNRRIYNEDAYTSVLPSIYLVEENYPLQASSEANPMSLKDVVLPSQPEKESPKISTSPLLRPATIIPPISRQILADSDNESVNNSETPIKNQGISRARDIFQDRRIKQPADKHAAFPIVKITDDIKSDFVDTNRDSPVAIWPRESEPIRNDVSSLSTDNYKGPLQLKPDITPLIAKPQLIADVAKRQFPQESNVLSDTVKIYTTSIDKQVTKKVNNASEMDTSNIIDTSRFRPFYLQISKLPESLATRQNIDLGHSIKAIQPITTKPEMKTDNIIKQSTLIGDRTVSSKIGQTLISPTHAIYNNESSKRLNTTEEDSLYSHETASEKGDISVQNLQREPILNQSLAQTQYEPSVVFAHEQTESATNNDIGTDNSLSKRDKDNLTLHLQTPISDSPLVERISSRLSPTPQKVYKPSTNTPLSEKIIQGEYDECTSSSPRYRNINQRLLDLPLVSLLQPKTEIDPGHPNELSRSISGIITEFTKSSSYAAPELALVPAAKKREAVPDTHVIVSTQQFETTNEQEAAPNVRIIAEKVYDLIKKDLKIERERERHRLLR